MLPDVEVVQHSVRKDDFTDKAGRKNNVLFFYMQAAQGGLISLPPIPPPYWSFARDEVLRSTLLYESLWSSAIYIALTKVSALSWDVKGDVALQIKRSHSLLLHAEDRRGWVPFMQKVLRDFLLTDNGSFIEIVRATKSSGSRIIGLMHLDSRRCTRTGDPDVPVIYRDRKGREHELKDYQVIAMSDMPDPAETYFGVGFCAASRAYRAIYKLSALETYVAEKVSGRRPLAIHFVNNVTPEQIQDGLKNAENQANQQGHIAYMGAVVVPNIDPSVTPAVATIDLAGLPEGYDAPHERRQAILAYADAIGIDPQELDPELLASKAMGTGAQARVIDDKASSRGIIAFRQELTYRLNWDVLPERTWFFFQERDFRDLKQRADVDSVLIDNVTKMVQGAFIEDIEGRQLLVDQDVLPREFMPVDITPTTQMADGDKLPPPVATEEERAAFVQEVQAAKLERQVQEQQLMTEASAPPMPPGQNGAKPKPKAKEAEAEDEDGMITIRMPKFEPVINVQVEPTPVTVNVPETHVVVPVPEVSLTMPPTPVTVNLPETVVKNTVQPSKAQVVVKEERPGKKHYRVVKRDEDKLIEEWEEV